MWHSVSAERGVLASGRAHYTRRGDGTLHGTRTVDGFDRPGTESAFLGP